MNRSYRYVGPPEIRARVAGHPGGTEIRSAADVLHWAARTGQDLGGDAPLAATFVIDRGGGLLIADRRSEHVACASGEDVLSAGEIFFDCNPDRRGNGVFVVDVSNHSTGYCPEPESWPAVATALERAGLPDPGEFTTVCVFRRCPSCGSRNLVKDGWFRCDVCGHDLPAEWNFG
jgi:hypothetical protein